ncbi:contractile injection system protein, VgrG/Pvc8 family [Bartonella ancashensis]|uniref:Phage tail protein D n=1 Tax=Bartonella ancashensis TaxID=1318743 RepID=A0A0M5KTF0_9HYPH|nr:contractile injection system protein, VgrG/Pvc8 family [Bartonella ancashensis]ALE02853.1 Phage tail protein D [Bartonella ancashensis]
MKPFCRIFSEGEDITYPLMDYVMSIEITDEAEDKSDRITIELDDRARESDNGFLDIPLIGTVLSVTLGYEDSKVRDMGMYLIDEIRVSSPPQSLSITGRAAFMNSSYRTPQSQSYHQQTLGEILQEIAERNGYTPQFDPTLAQIIVQHIDQIAESDMAFAVRLAGDYDAVAKPMDGYLVLAKRGSGKAITGDSLPGVVIHEKMCTSWCFEYSARNEVGAANGLKTEVGEDQKAAAEVQASTVNDEGHDFIHMDQSVMLAPKKAENSSVKEDPEKIIKERKGGVIAIYHDLRSGDKKEVKVGRSPFHALKYTYHNHLEAAAAIAAYRNQSIRGQSFFTCDMGGDPFIQSEAQLIQEPPFRAYIPAIWRIKSVKHNFSCSGGYTTSIDCELFEEEQEDTVKSMTDITQSDV